MLRLCVSFPTGGVDEGVPRDGAIFAVIVEVEQSTLPVAVVKLIADVPAKGTKLLPLLKHMQNKTKRCTFNSFYKSETCIGTQSTNYQVYVMF